MAEPAWATFAGVVAFVTLAIVVLARLSADAVGADSDDRGTSESTHEPRRDSGDGSQNEVDDPAVGESMPAGMLLANVALSQGLLGVVVVGGAWYAQVPAAALGLGAGSAAPRLLALGVAFGVALAAANELLAVVAERVGVGYSEALRGLLAPDSAVGWLALLGVALPVVAGFEELLFRGALVGAMAAGFGVSPWLLAAGSSLLFGVAHGAQGTTGMVVTGALGFALAAAFVVTDSLLVVVVAHYLVNALEFVVHEGLGVGVG